MAGDPAILKRTRACPFARGGRVLVRFRANGHSLFARRSGEPLARLRLTGNGDRVVLLYPSHRGGWGALGDFGASATPLDDALQCLSDNPYFLELRQTYGRAASAYRYTERRPFPGNHRSRYTVGAKRVCWSGSHTAVGGRPFWTRSATA